jgi:probable F420-dependent oxidoreductase
MATIIPEGRLVYGMQLQVQSQSRIYAEPWEATAGRDELAAIAAKADETGFFYVAVCDHVAIPKPMDEPMSTTWFDTVATLGWLAARTTNVRLLSHVFVAAYRHPLVTAKSFMTLDHLSGGRAILGVGVGHLQSEFDLLGVPFSERGAITDAALVEIRAAFDDEYVQDAGMRPRPAQTHLPIWVGGSSKAALRRAARLGDGWLPQATPLDQLPAAVAYLREERAAAGRGDDPIDIGAITEILYVGDPEWELKPSDLAGRPEQLAERLRAYGAAGANQLQVRFRNRSLDELLDQMDAFASEVAPLLNG